MKLSFKSLSHSAARAEEGGQKQTLPSSSQQIRIKGPPSAGTPAAATIAISNHSLSHHTQTTSPPLQLPAQQSVPALTLDGNQDDEDEFGSWECGQ